VVRALHELGSTAGGELVRIDPGARPPGDPALRAAAVYLDGIEQFSPEAQSQWVQRVTRAEAQGFQAGPRIFASTTGSRSSDCHRGDVSPKLRGLLLRFSIELPPLGERPEDLPEIADVLVERIGASVGRRIRLSPSACEFLKRQRWPGNIRQLEQLLERATAFSRGRQIPRKVVRELMGELEGSLTSIREQHNAVERDALLRALQEAGGNVTHAAELLGRSRSAVYRLLEKHGIPLARPS
jgi:DNA-binding NtrC family response regulator